MKEKFKERSKKALTEAIRRFKEKEKKIKEIKRKLLKDQQEIIDNFD